MLHFTFYHLKHHDIINNITHHFVRMHMYNVPVHAVHIAM